MGCGPPGSSIHGILQARILKWVAISFSRGSSWPRDQTRLSCIFCIGRWVLYHQSHLGSPHCYFSSIQSLSHVRLFATHGLGCKAYQTPLSFTISQSLCKLLSIESEIPSNHLILCRPLLLLPSIFPSICHHPYVTSGKTLTLTRRPLLASLLSSSNSIPLHPQS